MLFAEGIFLLFNANQGSEIYTDNDPMEPIKRMLGTGPFCINLNHYSRKIDEGCNGSCYVCVEL